LTEEDFEGKHQFCSIRHVHQQMFKCY